MQPALQPYATALQPYAIHPATACLVGEAQWLRLGLGLGLGLGLRLGGECTLPDRMSSPIARACSAKGTESGRSLLTS